MLRTISLYPAWQRLQNCEKSGTANCPVTSNVCWYDILEVLGELSTSLREVAPKALNFYAYESYFMLILWVVGHSSLMIRGKIHLRFQGERFFQAALMFLFFFLFFFFWDAETIWDHLQKITFVSLKPPCEGKPQMEQKYWQWIQLMPSRRDKVVVGLAENKLPGWQGKMLFWDTVDDAWLLAFWGWKTTAYCCRCWRNKIINLVKLSTVYH